MEVPYKALLSAVVLSMCSCAGPKKAQFADPALLLSYRKPDDIIFEQPIIHANKSLYTCSFSAEIPNYLKRSLEERGEKQVEKYVRDFEQRTGNRVAKVKADYITYLLEPDFFASEVDSGTEKRRATAILEKAIEFLECDELPNLEAEVIVPKSCLEIIEAGSLMKDSGMLGICIVPSLNGSLSANITLHTTDGQDVSQVAITVKESRQRPVEYFLQRVSGELSVKIETTAPVCSTHMQFLGAVYYQLPAMAVLEVTLAEKTKENIESGIVGSRDPDKILRNEVKRKDRLVNILSGTFVEAKLAGYINFTKSELEKSLIGSTDEIVSVERRQFLNKLSKGTDMKALVNEIVKRYSTDAGFLADYDAPY